MSLFRKFIVAVVSFLLGCCCQNAFAGDSGLLKLELQDPVAVGMGGAFTGEADRPSAVYYDPAGITQMDSPEVTAGLTWVQPHMSYESAVSGNGGTSQMKEDNYLFPEIFVTTPVIKDKLYIGVGESTDFGGGNDWEANGFSQFSTIKDSIEDKDYRLVVAYKIDDQWSVGVGAVNDDSDFEHDQGIYNQIPSSSNADALFKASDDAWGFDLGGMFKLNAQNQFGLDYKSPIHHTYDGALYLSNLNVNTLGSAGYFNATSLSTEAIQKLTLPQSITFGYDLKPTNKWTINFDLEWTDWAQYKQQATYYPNITNGTQLYVLGLGNPQARDWSSEWAESLGVQYSVTDAFRVRMGYQHHQSPVPENTFDTEFPDTDANAVTAGIGYDITSRLTIDIAYVADFGEVRTVNNTVGSAFLPVNETINLSGKYRQFVNIGTLSLTYKF